tara:strand:- start:1014 stop:1883 length:870 start_codon:yes stop_codon:yes gene_type:complete
MYFDEDLVLELRLNTLDNLVDFFVIVESTYTHKGEKRDLQFNIKKYEKFKKKIIYLTYDVEPKGIDIVNEDDNESIKSTKYILNAIKRENGQRNFIEKGLSNAVNEDVIMISDVDEIPNLLNADFNKMNNKIYLFKQDMFYYKFNLQIPNFKWVGTKACKKENLVSPQWLRNVKDRKYPFYRLDTLFSQTKYTNIKFVNQGGWHFSNIKTASEIEYKLKSYLHHREFDLEPLTKEQIENVIKSKKAIYDLKVDKRINKIGNGSELVQFDLRKLPKFLIENKEIYKNWLD